MKKITLLVLFLISTKIISQDFPDNPTQIKEIPSSPTMWEFEKYGNYPVSMHTGVPNISIPITTAQSGGLQVPISLNYHASGIKVDQKASWVGLGWNLNVGGAITRTVRGSQDEGNEGYINYPYSTQGTFDPAYSNNYHETEEMIQGFVDTEPDIFYYDFLGYSGKFVFNHNTIRTNATIALIPHNDLMITPTFNGASISSFVIVTPEGIVAEFAYPEISSEYRKAGLIGDLTVTANSTWHLKKLTAPNGIDEITFEYEFVSGTNPGFVTEESISSESESINYYDPCSSYNYTVTPSSYNVGIVYYDVKRINKITYQNGYILFDSSDENRYDDPDDEGLRLDAIKIYSSLNGSDELIKSYELEYDYFGTIDQSSPNPDYTVRLKLEKVYEVGSGGARNNPHEFFYKDTGFYNGLPDRFSPNQDYWGYYNGYGNNSLVPEIDYEVTPGSMLTLGDADREVNPLYTQAGIIEKIVYPTKGYSVFEFESNSVTMEGSAQEQHLTGGLRVKNISNFEANDSIQWQKYYEYVQKEDTTLSSGVYNGSQYISPSDFLSARDYYFTFSSDVSLGTHPPGSCYNYGTHGYITSNVGVASTPAIAKNFASAFYSTVKEYNGSPATHEGYKWYHYATTKDISYQGMGPISFNIDRSWDRGQLLLEETFEKSDSNPITTVTNNYQPIQIQSSVSGFKPRTRYDVESIGYYPPNSDAYTFRSIQYFLTYYEEPIIWKRLISTTTVHEGITTQKDFFYENSDHTQLTKIETKDSEENYLISKTRYPDDFISSTTLYDNTLIKGGALTSYTAIDRLKSNDLHQNATPIQVETYKKAGAIESFLSLQRTNFVDLGSDLVLPSTIQTLIEETDPLQIRVNYSEYDDFGNPQEISKQGGSPTVYIWSYNNTLPVAKIDNATFSEVESIMNSYSGGFITSLGIETDKEIIAGNLVQLRNDLATGVLSNALVSTYIYDPLIGTVMVTAPNGLNTHYQYDSLNRLKAVLNNDEDVVQYINYNYKSEPEIILSINTYNFSDAAGSKSVTVTSNRNWIVSESVSWLSLSTSSGSNNGSFIINCTANTGSARSATVTVTAEDITQTISITQDEKSLDFTLTQLGTSYQTSSFSNSTINSSEEPNVIYHYYIDSFNNYGNILLEGSDSFTFNIEYDYHAYGWVNANYNAANKTIELTFTDPNNNYTNYASVNVTANGITKILSIKFTSVSIPPH
ncbi:MAG: BACON domain-containing protein [Flavobacteriaceae bacterium]|nr:BACON domain-containing protein [Flavobacteriaceae bacterium]